VTSAANVRVWDPVVRLLHVGLIAGVAAAWTTTEFFSRWHEAAGYAVAAIVSMRLLWGCIGSPYARFTQFVRSPRHTLDYGREALHRRERRYLGHNPLGGWMVVALLASISGTAFTGWLYTTDLFFGDEAVEAVHLALAWTVVALVAAHVAGVVYTSVHHRDNLPRSMIDGRKRRPERDDVA
jgi:cytochrome b